MQAKELAKIALTTTRDMMNWYLSDLSDADLAVRPVPSANHIGWQLSHLIYSEKQLGSMLPGAAYPEIPPAIAKQGSDKAASAAPPNPAITKADYLDAFNKIRAATLAAADKLSESDLDKPTSGEMAKYAPNMGALLLLNANHTLMHAGQFTVVRRALNKPILF